MRKTIILSIVVLGAISNLSAEQVIMLGPFGKPIMVLDEASNWSIPIEVYSDSDVTEYIPDITTLGWISWHVEQFRQTGKYLVQLFAWYKNDQVCLKRLTEAQGTDPKFRDACKQLRYEEKMLSVDTRNKTITEVSSFLMEDDARVNPLNVSIGEHTVLSFDKAPRRISDAINRIDSIVTSEMNEYRGPSIQDALQKDREFAAQQAAFGMRGTLSEPVVSNEAENGVNREKASSGSVPIESNQKDGIYRVGGDVSAPTVIDSVDVAYPDSARRSKVSGAVLLSVVVNSNGLPTDIQIVKGLGDEFDKNAREAVSKYRFKPAVLRGNPVPVRINVEIDFRIH